MKKYRFTNGGIEFKRVDKRIARNAYKNGLTVVLCPVNIRPFSPWGLGMEMEINRNNQNCAGREFENVLNIFEFYNCRANAGKYTAFYIPVEEDEEAADVNLW